MLFRAQIPNDNLVLAHLLHSLREVLVIHGIDLARAWNHSRVRKPVVKLLDKRTVRACLERAG